MKTIREKTKKAILFAISTVAALSLGGGVGAITASAANDTTKLESLTTGGASVRVKGEAGIRFQSTMDDTDYQDLTAENSGFETGVIAIPADLLDNLNDLTLDNPNVANGVTTGEWSDREDGEEGKEAYAYFTALEMTEENYTRNIAFRSYYTINGATEYGNVLTRSLTYVANAAANDTTDEGKAKYEENKTTIDSYIKDYTVKYVNGVTEEVIDYKGVTESEPTAEEAALFGGEFKAWTTLGAAWDETAKNAITGDTVVKSNYTASETLDFTQATEVPTHLLNTIQKSTQQPKPLDSISVSGEKGLVVEDVYNSDYMQISFLNELTLTENDVIAVKVKVITVKECTNNWMNIYVNPTSSNPGTNSDSYIGCLKTGKLVDGVETGDGQTEIYQTFIYKVDADGLVLKTLGFASSTDSLPIDYSFEYIRIERYEEYASESVDFSNYNLLPGFVTYTTASAPYMENGKVRAWVGNTQYIKINYNGLILNKGDIIRYVVTTPSAAGLNLDINGSYKQWVNGNQTDVQMEFPIQETMTVNSIEFRCSSKTG
ncbi:MAG: hypothetical protein J6A63_09510, partial [Clostridia bacterium]|nr:hypothetical protein [Clostridia bacterium]